MNFRGFGNNSKVHGPSINVSDRERSNGDEWATYLVSTMSLFGGDKMGVGRCAYRGVSASCTREFMEVSRRVLAVSYHDGPMGKLCRLDLFSDFRATQVGRYRMARIGKRGAPGKYLLPTSGRGSFGVSAKR